MTRYVWRGGEWLKAHRVAPGPSLFPSIIRDHMDPLLHPCTGETLDSKSAFRAVTKAHGCVEVGNELPTPRRLEYDHADLQRDVAQAYAMLEQGYQAPPAAPADDDLRMLG
jgi:hypothetical protein